ncbi:cobyric acid synthase [Marivita sp. S6314]|uniref:cobyric acid synthase n=1 Tax=Marivita sp. S6314 TaxID=2926406 RepID=UPI001FF3DBFF|nr:cobyric acid synthase [Marivita sp. S6314]MCK0148864.1 cobyric acid synthase [Marivita sp. S6314]
MIQGTGSNVGKSMLVAGLCRAALRRGLSVAPFKPQNMSNNAAVTDDGGEIGRAQALQALACGRAPSVHMNPVLLKPESDRGSQVVVQGKVKGWLEARNFREDRGALMDVVLDSYHTLARTADLILIEGAGSPAEVNLRRGDIANMGFACAANVPVILAGDIDRGGVIAQIVGTQAVMTAQDNDRIAGFLINKFRGDVSLFEDGYTAIEAHTGWPGFGVLPWFDAAHLLPAEDAVDLSDVSTGEGYHVVCPMLSRIANFDDLDPLKAEPSVRVTMVPPGKPLPGDADLVVLPGTKSTRADLAFLRAQGWDVDIQAHLRRGGHVLGICGGYQMLGTCIEDPEGLEGPAGVTPGLGLLNVTTRMQPAKTLTRVTATHVPTGQPFEGYEIHIGTTDGPDTTRPFARIQDMPDGAISPTGQVMGTYLHGLFMSGGFRQAFLQAAGQASGAADYTRTVESTLDDLAEHMEAHLDIDGLLNAARPIAAR